MARKRSSNMESPMERTGARPTPPRMRRDSSAMPAGDGSVSESEVRDLAYRKWEEAGCPDGDGLAFWLAAESELRSSSAPAMSGPG